MIDAVVSSAAALVLALGTMPDADGGRVLVAQRTAPVAAVGALLNSDDGRRCTAFVVRSTTHDLIMTAAHCVSSTGGGLRFAPAYEGNSRPYGTWTVKKAYVDARWLTRQDEDVDYAVLEVAPRSFDGDEKNIEDVTGGFALGLTHSGAAQLQPRVRVTGYNNSDETPVGCAPLLAATDRTDPAIQCGGLSTGTSGSPWVASSGRGDATVNIVRGLTGGFEQGGCSDNVSYSPPLTPSARTLLSRAETGGPGDTLPRPDDPGC